MTGQDFQQGLVAGVTYLALCEVILRLLVNHLRNDFQWLVTYSRDERPIFQPDLTRKFFQRSFDPLLGWSTKAGSSGYEKGTAGEVQYHIDEDGSRRIAGNPTGEARIASFGDSYTFGRQVADHETWQSELTSKTNSIVLNFGVGNYGLDQAVLKYETTTLPKSVRVVIIGVVPETICRVHSHWKHYLEFGNILAFKPRFLLRKDKLVLLQSPIQSEADIQNLETFLPSLQDNDFFYRTKFRSFQYRGSYLISFFRHSRHNFRLISSLLIYKFKELIGAETQGARRASFNIIMKQNIKASHKMYADPMNCRLLAEIIKRFRDSATARGHAPVLLIMPQRLDLERVKEGSFPYTSFFEKMAEIVDVIDLSTTIRKQDTSAMYVEDVYGGHYSVRGNQVVAETVARCVTAFHPDLHSNL